MLSRSTTSALGNLIFDHLWRRGKGRSDAWLARSWWCLEVRRCAARFRSAEVWRTIAEKRMVEEEAIELGVAAFDAFAPRGHEDLVSSIEATFDQTLT